MTGDLHPTGPLDGDFERLLVCHDAEVGLRALICIDSTVLGPADGGVRMHPYPSAEAAVRDVTRLARAMTRKWAAAGEPRGGGKAVIVGDPRSAKSPALLERFGRVVDGLGGDYWAGEDAGITLTDMEAIGRGTGYVTTLPRHAGGAGDIAPSTAAGVLHAMRACVERALGRPDLAGLHVAVQGLGACGSEVVAGLVAAGARVTVADPDGHRVAAVVRRHGVAAVAPGAIYDVPADVFAPCALGGVIDRQTLPRLAVRVVAGSANDVMADEATEVAAVERGLVCAVDFVANAGGAIADADRFHPDGPDADRVAGKLAAIYDRTRWVLDRAGTTGRTPASVARELAEQRLSAAACCTDHLAGVDVTRQ